MNVSDYISSGILEAYVLDQLSDNERREVEDLVKGHPEIQKELEEIEQSFEALAHATSITPDATLKEKVMRDLSQPKKEIPIGYVRQEKTVSLFLKYATAASIAIAIGSAILALNYRQKWQATQMQLTDLIAQNQQYASNFNNVNQQLKDIQDDVAIMNNTSYTKVIMKGTDNSPNSLATIYWNQASQTVYLCIQELKYLTPDKQYQLWAIIDGEPMDAGVFDLKDDLLIPMKKIPSGAAAFAVTIEPKGGSGHPSMETMQVIGNV